MMLFINGILIHTSQLTWVIGHTNNVLTLWMQLFKIIRCFKTVPEPDIILKSISLVDYIKSIRTDLDKENTFCFLAEQLQLFTVSPNRCRYYVDTRVLYSTNIMQGTQSCKICYVCSAKDYYDLFYLI